MLLGMVCQRKQACQSHKAPDQDVLLSKQCQVYNIFLNLTCYIVCCADNAVRAVLPLILEHNEGTVGLLELQTTCSYRVCKVIGVNVPL